MTRGRGQQIRRAVERRDTNAAARERALVVAWLRRLGREGDLDASEYVDHECTKNHVDPDFIACAVEAGEHEPT